MLCSMFAVQALQQLAITLGEDPGLTHTAITWAPLLWRLTVAEPEGCVDWVILLTMLLV